MTSRKLERIKLEEIELDNPSLVYTLGWPTEDLRSSMAAVGLLNPPLLWQRAVVCGRKRLLAARELGWGEVDAWVVPAERLTAERAVEIALLDNLSHRSLSEAEKARAVAILVHDVGVPEDAARQHYLPLLGVKPAREALARYLLVGLSSRPVLELLEEDRIGLGTACNLASLSGGDQQKLCGVLVALRLGVNRNREVVEGIIDLAVRENVSVRDLTEQQWIRGCASPSAPRGERSGRRLVEELRLRLRPRSERWAATARGAASRWGQRTGMRLQIPLGREGRPWAIRLTFRTPSELREKAEVLTQECVLSELERITGKEA